MKVAITGASGFLGSYVLRHLVEGGSEALVLLRDPAAAWRIRDVLPRARVQRDSINYFPPMASQACRIGFFAEPGSPAMAWDEVAVSNRRACLGRLFFTIPGGIKTGQYFLNVKFENSMLRAPFRIFTEEEEKLVSKNYNDFRKQVKEAFAPPKKK